GALRLVVTAFVYEEISSRVPSADLVQIIAPGVIIGSFFIVLAAGAHRLPFATAIIAFGADAGYRPDVPDHARHRPGLRGSLWLPRGHAGPAPRGKPRAAESQSCVNARRRRIGRLETELKARP